MNIAGDKALINAPNALIRHCYRHGTGPNGWPAISRYGALLNYKLNLAASHRLPSSQPDPRNLRCPVRPGGQRTLLITPAGSFYSKIENSLSFF